MSETNLGAGCGLWAQCAISAFRRIISIYQTLGPFFLGARTQKVLLPGSQTKWNPVPLERKGTVVEQGRESGSVSFRPRILLLQTISAQESGMELDIYWNTDCRDLQDSGHFASFGEHFLLFSNHLIISKAI